MPQKDFPTWTYASRLGPFKDPKDMTKTWHGKLAWKTFSGYVVSYSNNFRFNQVLSLDPGFSFRLRRDPATFRTQILHGCTWRVWGADLMVIVPEKILMDEGRYVGVISQNLWGLIISILRIAWEPGTYFVLLLAYFLQMLLQSISFPAKTLHPKDKPSKIWNFPKVWISITKNRQIS